MKLDTLYSLYIHELQDLHSAEMQVKSALPKAVRAANSDDLKSSLRNHLETTRHHVERLNTILKKHGVKREEEKCKGMEGLLAECASMLAQDACGEIFDLGIIAACQRVEHYGMAGYGTARAYAERLGEEDDAVLLAETLEEASTADDELTSIATMLQSQCDLTFEENTEDHSTRPKVTRAGKREMTVAR